MEDMGYDWIPQSYSSTMRISGVHVCFQGRTTSSQPLLKKEHTDFPTSDLQNLQSKKWIQLSSRYQNHTILVGNFAVQLKHTGHVSNWIATWIFEPPSTIHNPSATPPNQRPKKMSANTLSLSPWLHPICKSQQFHLRKNWVNHFSLEFSLKAVLGHFQEDYLLLNEDKNNTGLASWGIFSCTGGIPANGEQSTIEHSKMPYKSPKILPTHNNTYICPQGAIDCVRELDQLDQVTLLSVGPPISQEPGLQPRWGLDLPFLGDTTKPRKSHWTHGIFV